MSDLAWLRSKLAELCGYKFMWNSEGGRMWVDGGLPGVPWSMFAPDEVVSQAIYCAEATKRTFEIDLRHGMWTVLIIAQKDGDEHHEASDRSLARALVLAIASALNLQPPEGV